MVETNKDHPLIIKLLVAYIIAFILGSMCLMVVIFVHAFSSQEMATLVSFNELGEGVLELGMVVLFFISLLFLNIYFTKYKKVKRKKK